LNQMPKGGSPVREIRSPGSVQGVPLALIERSSREVSLLEPQRALTPSAKSARNEFTDGPV
jgi:hypothetical protein